MGLLVDGIWRDQWYDTAATGGRFERKASAFRNWVTADGAPGPSGTGGFRAEPGRYHLYVSLACPWAHRTLIGRALKGLEAAVAVSVVDRTWAPRAGCSATARVRRRTRSTGRPGSTRSTVRPIRPTPAASPCRCSGTGRAPPSSPTNPPRSFGCWTAPSAARGRDLYPEDLRAEIDAVNARVYDRVNNGVYKAGFATAQAAYAEAFEALFAELDALEARLDRARYLCGDRLTEADIRLFTTLVRFDAVYVGHFKCNRRRIADYPTSRTTCATCSPCPGSRTR